MAVEDPGPIHHEETRRNRLRYLFYRKHHRPANKADAQWLPSLTPAEEFAIFDEADFAQIVDSKGNLFGMRRMPDGSILPLGTEDQEVAEFPQARPNEPWHGYPLWPLKKRTQNDRTRLPAPREAFDRMAAAGWITATQRKRLIKGNFLL